MTSFHTYILLQLSIFEIVLSLYILHVYQCTKSIYALAALLSGFGIMTLSVGLVPTVGDNSLRFILGRLGLYSGVVVFVSLLQLAIHYPVQTKIYRVITNALILLPVVVFFPIIFFAERFLEKIEIHDGSAYAVTGPWIITFILLAILYVILSVVLLMTKIKHVTRTQIVQLKLFIIILIFSALIGLLSDFILPYFGIKNNSSYGLEGAGILAIFIAGIVLQPSLHKMRTWA